MAEVKDAKAAFVITFSELEELVKLSDKEFAKWYVEKFKKLRIKEHETFCMTCKKAVALVEPKEHRKGTLVYALSKCPSCGRTLTKILYEYRGKSDQ